MRRGSWSRSLMRRLILFRHAKAEPRSAAGQDIDRPLGKVLAKEASFHRKFITQNM